MTNMLANSKNQQSLVSHQILVGVWARKLFLDNFPEIDDAEELSRILALSGFLHDVGKATDRFQNFLKRKIKKDNKLKQQNNVIIDDFEAESDLLENKPEFSHEHISWAYTLAFLSCHDRKNNKKMDMLAWLILHHHAQKPQGERVANAQHVYYQEVESKAKISAHMLEMFKKFKQYYGCDWLGFDDSYEPYAINMPCVTDWMTDRTNHNGIMRLMHACLCYADRLVSASFGSKDLENLVAKPLSDMESELGKYANKRFLTAFDLPKMSDSRSLDQKRIAKAAASTKNSCISAYAGAGKTRTSLLYINELAAMGGQTQAIYMMPKNDQAISIYGAIEKEQKILGMAFSVQLFLSGKVISDTRGPNQTPFSADIIVTNVDNTLSPQLKHGVIERILPICKSILILDEFNELLGKNSIPALLEHLLNGRHMAGSHTLFMSATPINLSVRMPILRSAFSNTIKTEFRPNDNPIRLNLFTFSEEIGDENRKDKHLTIHPTVATAQFAYANCPKKTGIYHAQKSDEDKKTQVSDLINEYGPSGTRPDCKSHSSPILTSSFDVSFDSMDICLLTPEMTVQAVGRVGRHDSREIMVNLFSKYSAADFQGAVDHMKSAIYTKPLSNKWTQFLQSRCGSRDMVINKTTLETWREEFNHQNKHEIAEWIERVFAESVKYLTKLGALYGSGGAAQTAQPLQTNTKGIREASNLYVDMPVLDENFEETSERKLANCNMGILRGLKESIVGHYDEYRRAAGLHYEKSKERNLPVELSLPSLPKSAGPGRIVYKARKPNHPLVSDWDGKEGHVVYVSGQGSKNTMGIMKRDTLSYIRSSMRGFEAETGDAAVSVRTSLESITNADLLDEDDTDV